MTLANAATGGETLEALRRQIEESSRLLALAEGMAGVGHWRFDLGTGIITWSEGVYRLKGADPETFEVTLESVVDFYHPDDQAGLQERIERAVETGQGYDLEMRIIRTDGEVRDVQARAQCEVDADGKVTALFGVIQDITEHKEALRAVRRNKALYKLVAENTDDSTGRISLDGEVLWASPACERLTGFTSAEMAGVKILHRTHPDDRPRLIERFRAVMRGDDVDPTVEYRYQHKDGRWIWVEAKPTLVRDEAGQPVEFIDVVRDISARKVAEARLADSEARFRRLTESGSDLVIEMTPDRTLTYASPSMFKLIGIRAEEAIGRPAAEFILPEDIPVVRARFEDGSLGDGAAVQCRMRRADGTVVWVEARPTFERDPVTGEVLRITDVVRDISAQKALQADLQAARTAAEQAAAVKAEFLANMSHELRTPLTSIIGFAGLLRARPTLDAESARFVDRLTTATDALQALVNDILDFSKLEAGQVEIETTPVMIRDLATASLELFLPQAEEKGVALEFRCDADVPDALALDAARTRQILLNLVGNALKFTPSGSVTLHVGWSGGRLACRVEDTGIGIPADKAARLFQRFSQVDGSINRMHGGTGLGLAISKGLVERMGGEIGLQSTPGAGSTFWFDIPAPEAVAPTAEAGDVARPAAGIAARVLVVDDNPANRELARLVLAAAGITPCEAANGLEAVGLAGQQPFDLILMDVRMPIMDGVSATRAIRAGGGPNRGVPILAFTAGGDGSDESALRSAGFDACVAKPIQPTVLLQTLAEWSDRSPRPDPAEGVCRGVG
ncbi:MAG: PAS domain S-box protein [Caulobacteraceae bacterium]|nr:PAS domain S-box protein [Caulobacteraceae bacterium]